ncbi:UNVERIFIED_CONTAM: TetR/AcrR family transcriptional regulator [Halobacillus marinus]
MNQDNENLSKQKQRTRTHLKEALTSLIKKKGYYAVTVKDIVETSAYNRSTFYTHYKDKEEMAEEMLHTLLHGLEEAVGSPYRPGQTVYTSKLNAPSFNIVAYVYDNRDMFELINYNDTLPGLLQGFPQTILSIYEERFLFQTINDLFVHMDYFKRYTAYGFYGLLQHWIAGGFATSKESFIEEVIALTRTHIYSLKYIGPEEETD